MTFLSAAKLVMRKLSSNQRPDQDTCDGMESLQKYPMMTL